MFQGPFDFSIIKHAQQKNLVQIAYTNIRDFGIGKHQLVDDTAYGGGVGMVMRVDVLHKAIEHAKDQSVPDKKRRIVLLSAQGKPFDQKTAREYAQLQQLVLICGHYEGVDERVKKYIDEEISIGDFVTTGGELPAMIITDALTRLLPGVLKDEATLHESFSQTGTDLNTVLLEYPQYTKPQVYDEQDVPEILLSGNHKKIAQWRDEQSNIRTLKIRPDLLSKKITD